MKNLIRGAALFIGGMIGVSGCLIYGMGGNPDPTVHGIAWIVCGLITVIGIILLFSKTEESNKTEEALLSTEELADKENEQ